MADAGFFKGTSAEQDSRFANKQKKLLKQMKFPDNIDIKIDMLKISLDILKPWITKRLQELLGIEDDVVIEFVFNQLEDKNPDPKMMQINLTGFLGGSKARLFIGELWNLLASAQSSTDGIPAELVEMKKKELLKRQEEDDRLREIRKREEDSHRQDIKSDMDKSDNKINGRNFMSSRNENGNNGGYKSRAYYDNNRRRSPQTTRRPRDLHSPRFKKSTRSVSKSSESENDRHYRQEKTKKNPTISSNRHDHPHSRSPIKSSRKNEKPQPSPVSNIPQPPTEIRLSSSSPSVEPSPKKPLRKKTNDSSENQIKEKPKETKKNKKQSKRTRSSSPISTSSRSRSPSPVRNKKKDEHKSRKHHRSTNNKRKSHRNHSDKSKTKTKHRNESLKKKISISSDNEILQISSPKKPRLESQIRVQTPPPSNDHKIQQPNRTVLLEDSRIDSIASLSTRVSTISNEEQSKPTNSSEDENEIDLRERLLREKAIKSMKRRQFSTNNNDRIVYETY